MSTDEYSSQKQVEIKDWPCATVRPNRLSKKKKVMLSHISHLLFMNKLLVEQAIARSLKNEHSISKMFFQHMILPTQESHFWKIPTYVYLLECIWMPVIKQFMWFCYNNLKTAGIPEQKKLSKRSNLLQL